MLPARSWPSWIPTTVTTGIMAFRNACLTSTAGSPSPLARAVLTYSSRRTSRIAERVVRANTVNGKEAERDRRQQQRSERGPHALAPAVEAAALDPAETHRKEQDQQQPGPERGHLDGELGEDHRE